MAWVLILLAPIVFAVLMALAVLKLAFVLLQAMFVPVRLLLPRR
jgi:hypothetical protein